jgi:thiamine biosynthesis lipoprotein
MTVEHRFRVMNTDALFVVHPRRGARDVPARLAAAEELAHECERRFSRFISTSELCHLNASAGKWVDVSPQMSEVLELAYGLHVQTGGLFDPGILADLESAGYDRTFEELPADRGSARSAPRRSGGFADIELGYGRVRLPPDVRVDLGGIVKGWSADLIADRLADLGPALVELGGDAAVRDVPPGADGWEIGVRAPGAADTLLGVVRVAAGGVATSGTDARRWKRDGAWAHHIIDPRTREPSRSELAQVTAFSHSAASAEVWAKAALIAGADESARIVASHAEVQLVLVPAHGEAVASSGAPFVYGPPVTA